MSLPAPATSFLFMPAIQQLNLVHAQAQMVNNSSDPAYLHTGTPETAGDTK